MLGTAERMSPLLMAVLTGLLIAQVALLVSTVYLHRSLSHRALRLSPGVRWTCRATTWMLTGMRPRQWVAVHRKHHACADTERDPHSPLILGYARVQFANAALYRKVARDPATVSRYARDIQVDRWDKLLFDRAYLGLGLGIAFLVSLFGWELALVVAGVHTVYYLLASGAINAVGHRWGRSPFDNRARNNQWLAWMVVGEGLHNNHHAAPTSSRFSLGPGEVDPGWWCIRLLVFFRLAVVRHVRATPEVRLPV
jgi:stearoyl-CoA desaturase (Delta-9 desaturase)